MSELMSQQSWILSNIIKLSVKGVGFVTCLTLLYTQEDEATKTIAFVGAMSLFGALAADIGIDGAFAAAHRCREQGYSPI